MIYTPLTDDYNKDLCALESTIFMLKIANMQYRQACKNCSKGTISYFQDKNDAYSELREDIYNQIWDDYYLDELNHEKRLELSKNSLWRKFEHMFPECKLTFDEVFKGGQCCYAPFLLKQESLINGETTEKFADLNNLYLDYQCNYLNYQQFLNFKTLLNQINSQVSEGGAEPWIKPTLSSKLAYVPIWAIREYATEAHDLLKQVKKDYVKFGVKYVKAERELAKNQIVNKHRKNLLVAKPNKKCLSKGLKT